MPRYFADGMAINKAHLIRVSDLIELRGCVLASCSFDGTVKLWDSTSGKLLRAFREPIPTRDPSPNFAIVDLGVNSWVAIGALSIIKRLEYMPVHLQRFGVNVDVVRELRRHRGRICALIRYKRKPFRHYLISGGEDKTIKLWSASGLTSFETLEGHSAEVMSLFELESGLLAGGARDRVIKIWNLEAGECVKSLEGHKGCIYSLVQLRNGLLVSASGDHTVRIWDLASGKCVDILHGHTDIVTRLVLLQDGRLASGSMDMTVRIWNLSNTDAAFCAETLKFHGEIGVLRQLANGRLAIGVNESVSIESVPSANRPAEASSSWGALASTLQGPPDSSAPEPEKKRGRSPLPVETVTLLRPRSRRRREEKQPMSGQDWLNAK